MKFVLIALSVFVVLGGLLGYSVTILPPIEGGEIVARNVAIILAEIWLVLAALFSFVHMLVDQLVNKSVAANDAIRRGLLFSSIVVGILWMRAYDVFSVLIAVLWVLTPILIEVIVIELRK